MNIKSLNLALVAALSLIANLSHADELQQKAAALFNPIPESPP